MDMKHSFFLGISKELIFNHNKLLLLATLYSNKKICRRGMPIKAMKYVAVI
jgi:hypothetical protein